MTRMAAYEGLEIAVLLPCYNEALTIAGVVAGFRTALPNAKIWVFDNNSSDETAATAARAGASVVRERRQGKGNVVRRMFADVEADIYIMADGDGTYDPAQAPDLVEKLIADRADMVVGTRRGVTADAGREGHAFGNRVFNEIYGTIFGKEFTDILSGYRAFTRRFVKSFPAVSSGFEIEAEMSVHASQLKMPTAEIELDYGRRPEGSHSKLATFKDGFKILVMIAMLMKETRPAAFFGLLASLFGIVSLVISVPVIHEFLLTGLVPRLPTAVLAMGMMMIAFLFTCCGLILDSVARSRVEQKRMIYLAQAGLKVQ